MSVIATIIIFHKQTRSIDIIIYIINNISRKGKECGIQQIITDHLKHKWQISDINYLSPFL